MTKQILTQEYLKSIIDYNESTGVFTWLYRNESEFKTERAAKRFNTQFAGKVAGSKGFEKGIFYLRIGVNGTLYRAHRLAWLYVNGSFPINHIDHIDGNGLNNRISNIRDVTNQENHKNCKLSKRNKSGCCGVWWCGKRQRWVAEIQSEGEKLYLGSFINLFDAVNVRKKSEIDNNYHENHGRR